MVPSHSAVAGTVLAHQGGWDEALFVAVPIAILVGLLWLAQRRAADEQRAQRSDADGDQPSATGTPPDGDRR
jgi:cyanate permease